MVDVEPVDRGRVFRRITLLLLLAIAAAGVWLFYRRQQAATGGPVSAEATEVRSTVTRAGDSLEVAVVWRLEIDSLRTAPESIRVEVGLSGAPQTSVSTSPADRRSDTLRVTSPAPGETASGYSCVTPIHRGRLHRETCTPWQFVLPAADTAPTARDTAPTRRTAATRAPRVTRIVVEPRGLQVDPDPNGTCTRWQRQNPGRSVWLDVNREAVPECPGVNGKPMVAQFCAFAELADGRRVLTENSASTPYCERLFRQWAAERVS